MLAVFDNDGTICDTQDVEGRCYAQAIERVTGRSLATLDWTTYDEPTSNAIVRDLLRDDPQADRKEAEIEREFLRLLVEQQPLFPGDFVPLAGAIGFIARLQRESVCTVAIATGCFASSEFAKDIQPSGPCAYFKSSTAMSERSRSNLDASVCHRLYSNRKQGTHVDVYYPMKLLPAFLPLLLLPLAACSHPSSAPQSREATRLPMLCVDPDEPLITALKTEPAKMQPWLQGDRLPPASLSDLGLQGEVRLVCEVGYLDGGSHGYVLADGAGHLFAFCTKIMTDQTAAFFLGGLHWSKPNLLRIAEGSASYRFLFDLLWSFADDPRYRPSPELIAKTCESSGMSKEEFMRLLKKPE